MGSGSSRHAPPSSSSSSYLSSSHPPLSTLPSASRHPRSPPSPSGRRKRRVLAPFLRSFSCGTSSSAWRAESLVNEDQSQDADLLTCQSKKPVAPDMNTPMGLSISSRGKGVDVEIKDNHALASDPNISDGVCTSNASKLLVTASASGSGCSAGSNTYFTQRSRNDQQECRETEKNPVLRTHKHTSSRDNGNTRFRLEIGSADTTCLVDSTSEQSELLVPGLSASRSFSEDLEIRPASDTNSLGINGNVMSPGTLPVFEAHRAALPLEAAPAGNNNLGREEAARIVPTRGSTAANQSENMGLLHIDALGLASQSSDESPTISRGEASGREARRNNRRRLWDALTRATSRRRTFSSAFLVPSEEIDGLGPWNDGWGLFDWSSSDEGGESGFIGSRSSEMAERRRSRPQVWALQHFSSGMEGAPVHSRHCAMGRHPNGRCSCEAFVMTEETSTRASISRIVMLAEALFEVLDEIHRQSVALSRSTSLSLVSLPAPEAVVDSFPIRTHKKNAKLDGVAEESVECYICLVEYEDGDKVRTLPCCHEFHMCCVDKWLKEVHRVCPLCRGNVCDATPGSFQVAVV